MKCKWCDVETEHTDCVCFKCWSYLTNLDHALHTPILFTMLKIKVAERTSEIYKDGHF